MKNEAKKEESLPLVSVAIITYNQKEYLKECIESVLAQDYKNLEIVVADDCSTDGTQEMLKEYVKKYPDKFVLKLSDKNQGITGNSTNAINACSGKYIVLIGGDDILLENKIQRQVEFLEANEDFVLCGTYTNIIDEKGNLIRQVKDFKKKKNPIYSLCELIESGNGLVPVVSYMFRRDAIPKEGFDYRLPVASDSLFMYHVASKGKIYVIKEFLTAYRVHSKQISAKGYFDDSLVSLALSEFFFLECYKSIHKSRSLFFFAQGRKYHKQGKFTDAKIHYLASLNIRFNIKALIALFLTLLGIKR